MTEVIARRRKGWIGVDVGTRSVKLAQIERGAKGPRLLDAQVVPRTLDSPQTDEPEDAFAGVRNEIECALSLGKRFSGTSAVCTISAGQCRFRPFKVREATSAEQRAMVDAELDAAEQAPPSGRWFSFWHTGSADQESDPSGLHVIAHSMSRQCSARVVAEILRAGLFSRALDSSPLALGRVLAMTAGSEAAEAVAALDWGFSAATFCVIQRGVPIFVRRLRDCGFRHVLDSLRTAFGLSIEDVECLFATSDPAAKRRLGDASAMVQKAVPEVAAQSLERMVAELQRTLRFLNSHQSQAVPRKMWLFGAGSLWENACEYLATRVEPRPEQWRLEATRIEHAAALAPTSGLLAVAIGASSFPWSAQ